MGMYTKFTDEQLADEVRTFLDASGEKSIMLSHDGRTNIAKTFMRLDKEIGLRNNPQLKNWAEIAWINFTRRLGLVPGHPEFDMLSLT